MITLTPLGLLFVIVLSFLAGAAVVIGLFAWLAFGIGHKW